MNKFKTVKANIKFNKNLHKAQKDAYDATLAHYEEFNDFKHRECLIVMPTGTGKTGVMSILPFNISNGRVLIITPGKIIRKTVFSNFDTVNNPESTFWIKRNVIYDNNSLPKSYLYDGFNPDNDGAKELSLQKLNASDIVVTNIHKIVNSSEDINLINLVDENFFDMIIIDEAHHVAADMWQRALNHFKAPKVIKLTATPFRSDKLEISTNSYDPIYEYTLGEAIDDKLVKNIVKKEAIPGDLTFIDKTTNAEYNLSEAKQVLGNHFVNRSIAMSKPCSKQVIDKTKKTLLDKRQSYEKHQVLAITCNDEHAQDVCKWFNEAGLNATYVSTRSLSDKQIEQRLSDYANGIYDVMVSIQLLGEGYDNPNISIISLFRPFKSLGPYAQSIGRGLRKIYADNLLPIDNYCNVVHHQELGLEDLWVYYKNQETFGQMIKAQKRHLTEQLSFDFEELGFVEMESPPRKPRANDDDLSNVTVRNVLGTKTYSPGGFGNDDSFTTEGVSEYQESLQMLTMAKDKEISAYKLELDKKVKDSILSEKEAEILLDNRTESIQQEVNKEYTNFDDLIIAESLRSDFSNWLNTKIEDFFKASNLTKEGTELAQDSLSVDTEAINNIGYLTKNIRQTLYQESKKNVDTYHKIDFAKAKERVIEKIDYLYVQYGAKKEE